jgi:polar amino acid transport system substrate-binding protein
MTACGGSKPAETTAAATEAETSAEESTAEETTAEAADEAGELGGTFTVGFDQDFPPMGFVGDDGEYTGFDLELAKEVADRLALSLFRSRSHGTQRIWN